MDATTGPLVAVACPFEVGANACGSCFVGGPAITSKLIDL